MGVNQLHIRFLVNLSAQEPYERIERVFFHSATVAPHGRQQRAARHHAALISDEDL
jgi:hypothetical protein